MKFQNFHLNSGRRRKTFHSTRNIDGFGSPNGPKCTLGQKVRFLMKMMKIHEIHGNFTFPWKSWKSALFEVKITSRNGHLSIAKSTFSFSGGNFTKCPEISRNFMKFHEISWISTISWKFEIRGQTKPKSPILDACAVAERILGPNSAQKCILGQNPPKWRISAIFHDFR